MAGRGNRRGAAAPLQTRSAARTASQPQLQRQPSTEAKFDVTFRDDDLDPVVIERDFLRMRRDLINHERAKMARENAIFDRQDDVPGSSNSTAVNDDVTGETFPDRIHEIALQVPGVAPKHINAIHLSTLEPLNLVHLRTGIGRTLDSDTTLSYTNGRISLRSQKGTIRDFGDTPLLWMECFTTYAHIYALLFGKEHPQVLAALFHFLNLVIRKSQSYNWPTCLRFALDWYTNVFAKTPHIAANWTDIPVNW